MFEELVTFVDYELRKVRERLSQEPGLELVLSEDAREFLIDKGYSPDFGARPLRRAIEQHIEDAISEEILRGSYKGKTTINVSVKTDEGAEDEQEAKHLFFECSGEAVVKSDQPVEQVHE